ncbi:PGAP1-like protein-domain-containing protein [Vararia minispora EC-137]|uniref:PGAP1-like protein-domain-containing protein n=1 Tax=Vararia minispora EC-137 TaxID=1314806 RepID=A0ACB8QHE0_9AGAM|nr:PGAP1-like protein-domain-containing protein [Vararia minispora EC-137]
MPRAPPLSLALLGVAAFVILHSLFRAAKNATTMLAPQGCRMAYMSPSYLIQPLDASWTPLASRYSLSLYREVGWEHTAPSGLPVLFLPGNAGSSHQVRSLAGSAARQFYASPYAEAPAFADHAPLDFFALEHNGDLSALHAPTLRAETTYAEAAASYILSLYPADTPLLVVGHSMGGIVAAGLLRTTLAPRISALITLSTPHRLPPARFDARFDALYAQHLATLSDPALHTPILSLCGGAADAQVPAETCVLPRPPSFDALGVFRHTAFTTAIDGCWTAVGHDVAVWCDQLRWALARALLELAPLPNITARADVLTTYFLSARDRMAPRTLTLKDRSPRYYTPNQRLALDKPAKNELHMLPLPFERAVFVMFLWDGSMRAIGPRRRESLVTAWIHVCRQAPDTTGDSHECAFKEPFHVRMLPDLRKFIKRGAPVAGRGVEDDNGVVVLEADVPLFEDSTRPGWIAVEVEGTDGKGAIFAGFAPAAPIVVDASVYSLLWRPARIRLPPLALRTEIRFPHLIEDARLVYRIMPLFAHGAFCAFARVPPLLAHTSQYTNESYFHPLSIPQPARLHSHTSGPFLPPAPPGLNVTLYASSEPVCDLRALEIRVDIGTSIGRIAARYWMAVPAWGAGVAGYLLYGAWRASEAGSPPPTTISSLRTLTHRLPFFSFLSLVLALLPLPPHAYLSTGTLPFLAPLAPLLLVLATGLVCVSWGMLSLFITLIGRIAARYKDPAPPPSPRATLTSLAAITALVALLVPWQVAFLGCWAVQLYTCAIGRPGARLPLENDATPPPSAPDAAYALQTHFLLLSTWLLPLVAPMLAVYTRTVLGGAFRPTVLTGDHNPLPVLPWLVWADWAGRGKPVFATPAKPHPLLAHLPVFALAAAFLYGARSPHAVYTAWTLVVAAMLGVRVGARYWGGRAWA